MSILDTFEKKMKSIVKLNALSAIAPLLLLGGGVYLYKELNTVITKQNEKQELLFKALDKQGLPGKLLKVIDEKLGDKVPVESKVEVVNTLIMMCSAKNIPIHIACGLIEVESGWNVKATSEVGAKGLLQVMPATAKPYLRVERKPANSDELYNPNTSIIVGLSYLADLQAQYVDLGVTESDNYTLALHNYFWGGANTAALLSKKDTRVNVPNFSYPLRVMAAAKPYKDMGF